MPELPEVQTTVDGINKVARGRTIVDVWTNYNSAHYANKDEIKNPLFFSKFKREIIGAKIVRAERRAKNILIFTEKTGNAKNGSVILIHMKMTGHIMYGSYIFNKKNTKDPWSANEDGPLRDPFNRHIRLVFTFDNGKYLVLSDMRKFAKVTLIKSPQHIHKSTHLANIGPEPLDNSFTFSLFKERLFSRVKLGNKSSPKIKALLLDQTVLAGVGNIYSDESLWRAGIHPEQPIHTVPTEKLKKLYTSIKEVLKSGIDFGGDSMSDYRNIYGERGGFQEKHNAYRKTGKLCSKKGCAGKICRKVVVGRGSHFCNVHQKLI